LIDVSPDQAQHGLRASLAHLEPISLQQEGERVWEGFVHIFHLERASATQAFAWSSRVEGSDERKFYAVLQAGPITSAQDAARASIVADVRSS
jgi:hypothetical protein